MGFTLCQNLPIEWGVIKLYYYALSNLHELNSLKCNLSPHFMYHMLKTPLPYFLTYNFSLACLVCLITSIHLSHFLWRLSGVPFSVWPSFIFCMTIVTCLTLVNAFCSPMLTMSSWQTKIVSSFPLYHSPSQTTRGIVDVSQLLV